MAQPFKPKSIQVLNSFGFLIVLEGAVRSAKTFTSLVKWYHYILNSPEKIFLMSGNTQGSLSRNCLIGDYGFIAITGNKAVQKTDTDGSKYLALGDKKIFYCGADNKKSFEKIRGITLGGWYADEISLHHKDFIETALARSFVSSDRMNIWTLNPEVPTHFIYTDYIDKYKEQETKGYNYFHFLMTDNPAITIDRAEEISNQFTGIFYKRYVLGLRVRAEGSCYPSYTDDLVIDKIPSDWKILFINIGVDIGGNKSATSFTATGFFRIGTQLQIIVLDELHDTLNKSVEVVLDNFTKFGQKQKQEYIISEIYVDSAEQLILKSMRNLNLATTRGSLKKPIVDRIRFLDLMMSKKRVHFMKHCKNTTDAIQSAVWDNKSSKEERLDDGTINIDSLDSLEYSYEKQMRDFI